MASSVLKVRVFGMLDIKRFGRLAYENSSHSVMLFGRFARRRASVTDFIVILMRSNNQLSSSGFGSVTKGTPSSASSAVSFGVAVPWMGRSSTLP